MKSPQSQWHFGRLGHNFSTDEVRNWIDFGLFFVLKTAQKQLIFVRKEPFSALICSGNAVDKLWDTIFSDQE